MKLEELFLKESKGISIQGIHFSKSENRSFLDATQAGKGLPGQERKRKALYPETFINDRVYFYVKETFKRKEPGLGKYAYVATLHNLYDMSKDPLNLKKVALHKSKEETGFVIGPLASNLFEQYVFNNGYSGYFDKGVIVYFKDVTHIERTPDLDQ